MMMPETQTFEPEAFGTMRGAMLILLVGAALGVTFNMMGLASRPKHGLAWIKTPEKIASLESLLSAPAAPAGKVEAAPADGPGSGDAAAATAATPPNPAPMAAAASASTSDSTGAHAATVAHPDSAAHAHAKKSTKKSSTTHTGTTSKSASTTKTTATSKSSGTPAASSASGSAGKPAATAPAAQAGAAAPAAAPAASAAAGAAATPPADLPNIPDVTGPLKVELATFRKLYDANAALVVDARETEDYTDGHIKGALSIPYNDAMADPDKVKKLDPAGRPIVVYCSGGDCELSMDLAKVMVDAGKRKVLVYQGGFPEWERSNLPISKGANP